MHGQITKIKQIEMQGTEVVHINWTSLDGTNKLSITLPARVAPEFEMYQRVREEEFYTSLGGYQDEVRAVK